MKGEKKEVENMEEKKDEKGRE
jgi:hypothetical protein